MTLLDGSTLLLILIFGFFLAAALAPFETLGWWAGWFGPDPQDDGHEEASAQDAPPFKRYAVFLSGIHTVSEETYARREQGLLEALRERSPDTAFTEIFPYSANNLALTGQRFFAGFWRLALRLKLSRFGFAGIIINLRNVFQVAVSADRRYGPIYNQGTAETILRALRQEDYRRQEGLPVILIGYSGGGQIAVGTAGHLAAMTGAPVTVISLGGIMASEESMLTLKRLYHLVGERDRVQKLGYMFPGRWPLLGYSAWNQGLAKGVIQIVPMGPVDHTGRDGYLDIKHILPDGRSSFQQTVDVIAAILEGAEGLPTVAQVAAKTPAGL